MEDNGIISLNEHADSLEKVTTVKRPNSEIKEVVASSIGPCVSSSQLPLAEIRGLQTAQHNSETFFSSLFSNGSC